MSTWPKDHSAGSHHSCGIISKSQNGLRLRWLLGQKVPRCRPSLTLAEQSTGPSRAEGSHSALATMPWGEAPEAGAPGCQEKLDFYFF